MTKPLTPLEKRAEQDFCQGVKERGGLTRKMNGLGYRSWPDRECLKPRVRAPLWVEFKRLGETLTPQQEFVHRQLKRLGQKVVVCFTAEEALEAYDRHQ